MKARRSALSLEIDIRLTSDEIIELAKGKTLEGMIRINQEQVGPAVEKPLKIKVDRAEKEYIRRVLLPENCCFETIQAYEIILSEEAHKDLARKEATGDRISGDEIIIVTETYHKGHYF